MKLEKFTHEFGEESFNKFCIIGFKYQLKNKNNVDEGKDYLAILICLKKDTNREVIFKFKKEIKEKYQKAIFNSNNYFNLQSYNLNENHSMQFYEHYLNINSFKKTESQKPGLSKYFTSFTKEGIVMNKMKDFMPNSVMNSFRYDQIIKCRGYHPESLKSHLKPQLKNFFKNNSCCVSIIVNLFTQCSSVMFCSAYTNQFQCSVDTKLFKATLYSNCMKQNLGNLHKMAKVFKGDFTKIPEIDFLDKATYVFLLREIMYKNIIQQISKESNLYKIVKSIESKAKTYHFQIMEKIKPHCIIKFPQIGKENDLGK